MVCTGMKKDPAIVPGECARAIDTFREDYIADGRWIQAQIAVRKYQRKNLATGFGYMEEFACMLSFLAGYAPEMPVRVASDIVSKLIKERRKM